jgi:hypothetical protein
VIAQTLARHEAPIRMPRDYAPDHTGSDMIGLWAPGVDSDGQSDETPFVVLAFR